MRQPPTGRGFRRWLGAPITVLALVVASCGGDDDDDASTTGQATTSTESSAPTGTDGGSGTAAPTTDATANTSATDSSTVTTAGASTSGDAEPSSAPAEAPTGDSIKLSVMATASGITGVPHLFDNAQAAVDAINAAGGIPDRAGGPGHPLELIECRVEGADSTSVPQVALDCANHAIDEGVVADVGKYLFAQLAVPAFEQASVPLIGTFLVDETDITNPAVFGLSGGAVMELPGTGVVLENAGATTLGFVSADNPAGRSLPAFIAPALRSSSITIEQYLPLDPSADVATVVSKLVQENPDGIILGQTASVSVRLTQALRAAGYEGMIGFSGANLNADTIEQLGDDTDNILSASNYPAVTDNANPGIQQYNAEMDEFAPDALRDEFGLNAWFAVHVAADILATLDEYTPEAMLAATKGFAVDTGLVPAFTIGVPDNYLQLPNIPRQTVFPVSIVDGQLVGTGDAINLNPAG